MKLLPFTLVLFSLAGAGLAAAAPNFIFILADDLGYGELGCYGQKVIETPRLDRMAAEGMRFTQFYAGATVCAPSRCVLMTGLHNGHCSVRGNGTGAEQALREKDRTVAQMFQNNGYATALIGKWGLGDYRTETDVGLPNRKGFDYFYGYANQVHAHNYYPEFLWRNQDRDELRNEVKHVDRSYGGFTGGAATKRIDYSHDLFAKEAMDWVREHQEKPFFLYLALTIPHANNEGTRLTGDGAEVPDDGPYEDRDWPSQDKGQAAMITRMDRDVGRLLDLLQELKLAGNTLVIFSSDNGPHNEAGHNLERFQPSGPLRGTKRALSEGGIRVPTIAWWPGRIKPGTVSDHIGYFGDIYATACDLVDRKSPENLDSVSFLPTLLGRPERQREHDFLYWEFYEQGSRQAVRFGVWKAIREPMFTGKVALYNLETDLGETKDVSVENSDVTEKAIQFMNSAHVPDERWRVR